MTEFALVVPFLLIILLLVADFGRFFAAGISVESIARASAEVTAQEYQRASPVDYVALHTYAWQSVCDEANRLATITYNGQGVQCDGIPTMVCVHDTADGICSTVYNSTSGIPAECTLLLDPIANTQTGGSETSKYVEVRVCYKFSTIFPFKIPFVGGSLSPISGDFWIQKVRTFTVADY